MSKRKKIEKIETGSSMEGSNMGGSKPNIKRVRQRQLNAPEYPPTHGGLLGTQQIDWKKDKGKTPTGRGGSGSHNMVNRKTKIVEDMIKEGDGGGGDGGFGDGGGTVFTSTNAGIFNPTYGSNGKKPRVKSKKKRTGIERLGVFLTDGSPERKMTKALQEWVENSILNEEPPKVVERKGHLDKTAAVKQKDMEDKISSLDDSAKKSGERSEFPNDHVSSHIADVKLSKQPQAFGNPQDDELKRGSKKDNSKWSESVELEIEKFIADLNNKRGSILDEINIRKSNTVESLIRRY
tara:strand:+ start:1077 stop:1955 length:879 start_codon:yes stop_codon:yes gene_type:complete